MKELAILLNALILYARACHNMATGSTFLQDHDFFADIYGGAEAGYDSVIERCIGTGIKIDIQDINLQAAKTSAAIDLGKTNEDKLSACLEMEKQISSLVDKLVKSGKFSNGTEQLIGDIANASEVTQYKIQQRLAK